MRSFKIDCLINWDSSSFLLNQFIAEISLARKKYIHHFQAETSLTYGNLETALVHYFCASWWNFGGLRQRVQSIFFLYKCDISEPRCPCFFFAWKWLEQTVKQEKILFCFLFRRLRDKPGWKITSLCFWTKKLWLISA